MAFTKWRLKRYGELECEKLEAAKNVKTSHTHAHTHKYTHTDTHILTSSLRNEYIDFIKFLPPKKSLFYSNIFGNEK